MIEIEATLMWIRSEVGRIETASMTIFFEKFDHDKEKRDSVLAAREFCLRGCFFCLFCFCLLVIKRERFKPSLFILFF